LTCQQVTEAIVDYVTEEMDQPTRQAFERHLSRCTDCTAFFHTYQETIRATRAVHYEAIPGDMLSRVEQFLHAKMRPERPS
jgi:anti-sigma factor RsiW